jgi:aspartyl-tRNA(Asn)/glutamyl-tRNA(Gln) amidotransferase subunit A
MAIFSGFPEYWRETMNRLQMSAADLARAVKNREVSAAENVQASIARIEEVEGRVHALLTPLFDRALEKAAQIDQKVGKGEDPGPLAGVPVIVKDNLCMRGLKTTCGSRMLENWRPPYDASTVRFMEEAGAVILGKANMDEFAMGSSTENSAFFPTLNPWDLDRVPGGSSGGSAASVACGYAPLALGSDTGGSIRQPAAFCGVYGLKPTYGLISRYGLVAFASSLDQVGPFSRSVEDLALVLNVLAKPDPADATSSRRERPDFMTFLGKENLKGLRVGVVSEFEAYPVQPEIKEAMERVQNILREAGARFSCVNLPTTIEAGLPCYYIIAPAEASSNLARYDGVRYGLSVEARNLGDLYMKTRGRGFGAEVKRRILTGTYVLSSGYYDAYYLVALKARTKISREFKEAFKDVDMLLMPTTPTLPFRQGENVEDPIQMYLGDVFTLPVNLASLPGLSLNAGYSKTGLPVGIQLVGPQWGEGTLLAAAEAVERVLGKPACAFGGV